MRKNRCDFYEGKWYVIYVWEFFQKICKHVDKGEPGDANYWDFQKVVGKIHPQKFEKLNCMEKEHILKLYR